MPSRIIRDSCRTSPNLDALSDAAERMFWRLTTVADDFGRFESDPRVLLSSCFPLRVDRVKPTQVKRWLEEMVSCELVTTYVVNGRHYAFFNTWEKHQRVRAKESKHPAPTSDNICRQTLSNAPVFGGMESKVRNVSDNTSPSPQAAEGVTDPSLNGWGTPEALIALYNADTPAEFASVTTLSPGRRSKANKYLSAFPRRDFWVQVFAECCASSFLRGLTVGKDGRTFHGSTLDWLLTKGKDGTENCVKVAEGNYGDG